MLQVLLYQMNMFVLQKHKIIHRKLLWGFKYIRFKSSKSPAGASTKDVLKIRTSELAEILDCTSHTAQNIIYKNRIILSLDADSFTRNSKFCSKYLKLSDVVEFPSLITLNSSLLQHRYFSLLELGFSNITANNILKYLQLIRKTPKQLEIEGVNVSFKKSINYCMEFLSDSPCEMRPELRFHIQNMYKNGSTLSKIKEIMNAEILASNLNCSIAKTHRMFQRYPPLRVQSIGNILKALDILVQKYNVPVSKVLYTPNLFALHHEILDNFLEKVPVVLGMSTIELIQKMPIVLRLSVNSLRQIEGVLQSFDINEKQLLCCPKIITYSTSTLQDRLKVLCKSEVFGLWRNHKKFLWLVYYFNRLDTRLELLKAINVPYSINMFSTSDTRFHNYLRCDSCKSITHEICHYLAKKLGLKERDIFEKLHGHPNSDTFSLVNCSKVVEFLLNSGITKKQLFNGLDIIVYDIDIVTMHFNNLSNNPRCQPFSEWISHFNLIQLLIYVIEVESGFRGSRSNASQIRSEDSEDLSLSGFAF